MTQELFKYACWPIATVIITLCFMLSQKNAITALIGRIIKLKVAGSELETPYHSDEPKVTLNSTPDNSQKDTATKLAALESDFNDLLVRQLAGNSIIMSNLADNLWNRNLLRIMQTRPEDVFQKIKEVIKDKSAANDIEIVKSALDPVFLSSNFNRAKVMEAHLKSEMLIDYLRRMVEYKIPS